MRFYLLILLVCALGACTIEKPIYSKGTVIITRSDYRSYIIDSVQNRKSHKVFYVATDILTGRQVSNILQEAIDPQRLNYQKNIK